MKREIKFRGKASNMLYNGADILHHKGDWLYGDLIHQNGKCLIAPVDKQYPYGTSFLSFVVDADTVGQSTGLTDRYGEEIFENDIVDTQYNFGIGWIEYSAPCFGVSDKKGICIDFEWEDWNRFEVLGNKFDNPSLLSDKKR